MTLYAESLAGFTAEFDTLADYERSWFWGSSKLRYRISGLPLTCFICGDGEIELHHRSYAHVGHERHDELVPLCGDHHRMVERLVRGGWASRWDAHALLARRLERRRGRDLRSLGSSPHLHREMPEVFPG